jgi:D-alanyl-lipoteichoic acid acyltransferase DltB (MBOAT superfamily)
VLFTSYEFVLVFLPLVVLAVLGASGLGHRALAKLLLFAASLAFYAWWNPSYVALLLAILGFNFTIGNWLIRTQDDPGLARRRTAVLVFGLATNIALLVYFKYTGFLLGAIGDAIGEEFAIGKIVLPLGISFITFQKIAFLVDAYSGQIKQLSALDYALFVSFFPQLISGPIVHHREVIPQFQSPTTLRYARQVVPVAIAFFVMGAAKKVIIADYFSSHVAVAFDAAAAGAHQGFAAAWRGALAYTVQIYFDFSGYSDMAIGLGLLFGIRLPFNFNSPLKATSIIDFWSRWHMTLSRFLTAYIYNPIVVRGTRRLMRRGKKAVVKGVMPLGPFITVLALPTLFTMFIAGAWHGAGFQFLVFGLFHGGYLVVNHAWRNLRRAVGKPPISTARQSVIASRALTLLALVISIPWFRASSVHAAGVLLSDMLLLHRGGHAPGAQVGRSFLLALGLAWLASQILPNTQEIMRDQLDRVTGPLAKHAGAGNSSESWSWPPLAWRPTIGWALALGVLAWYVVLHLASPTEFLYFQF